MVFSAILDAVLGQEISLINQSLFSTKSFPPVKEIITTSFETTTREVFTGRWEVFNDPLLDPRLISDDPVEREGLRTLLLNSNWFDNNDIIQMTIDYQKVRTYFYTEHEQKDGYLTLCGGAMFGSDRFFTCWNMTKEDIDKYDTYGTFKFIVENNIVAFVSDMVILLIVGTLGLIGLQFHNFKFVKIDVP